MRPAKSFLFLPCQGHGEIATTSGFSLAILLPVGLGSCCTVNKQSASTGFTPKSWLDLLSTVSRLMKLSLLSLFSELLLLKLLVLLSVLFLLTSFNGSNAYRFTRSSSSRLSLIPHCKSRSRSVVCTGVDCWSGDICRETVTLPLNWETAVRWKCRLPGVCLTVSSWLEWSCATKPSFDW